MITINRYRLGPCCFRASSLSWAFILFAFGTFRCAHAFDPATEFAASFFITFAPILSLFGEEPAKQFISLSVSWEEDVLFAVAPLGILTIVIGAIRVGGYTWMRDLIGRAREPSGVSEMQYLSSTSDSVYEFWDRKGIVRQLGNSKVHPLLFDNTPGSQDVMSMWDAEHPQEAGQPASSQESYIRRRDKFKRELQPTDPEVRRNWYTLPPNLTLNAHGPMVESFWIVYWTIIAIIIQLGAVAFQATATYHLKWRNPDFPQFYNPRFAFPLAVGGLFFLCSGVFMCARLIEGVTQEIVWDEGQRSKDEKRQFQIMWIQQHNAEASIEPFAIYRKDPNLPHDKSFRPIWGSYLQGSPRSVMSAKLWVFAGTMFCIVGFLSQVIGLRGLHFSATLAQLIA